MSTPTKIGVIGCGNISKAYLPAGEKFANLEVVACADLDLARAKAAAEAHGIPRACSVDDLLATRDIEIVVNAHLSASSPAGHGSEADRINEEHTCLARFASRMALSAYQVLRPLLRLLPGYKKPCGALHHIGSQLAENQAQWLIRS